MDFRWLIEMEKHSRMVREAFGMVCKLCGKVSCYDPGGFKDESLKTDSGGKIEHIPK